MALSLDGTTGISATGNIISSAGIISATGNIYGGNIIGTLVVASATFSGNVSGGNLLTGGIVSATSTITSAANISGGNILTGGLISATSTITGTSHLGAVVSVTANVTGGNLLTGGLISAAGTVTGTSHLGAVVSVTGAITGAAITGSSLTVSTGNISGGNIVNNNANGVGNIGSSTVYFNTVFGKATTAQYADLAELYSADAKYEPGTVLVFGGNNEVTVSTVSADPRVAGVVSTNPAHLMNSVLESEHKVAVALTGRVPTSVTGTIRKGDMMVTAANGVAQASAAPAMGTVIGKALENFDGVSGTIEIVVGRL